MDLHAHFLFHQKASAALNYLNGRSARKDFDRLLNAQKMLRAGFTTHCAIRASGEERVSLRRAGNYQMTSILGGTS